MIEFTDSFSQAAVAEACSAFPDLLKRLSLELTLQIFERPLNEQGRIIGPAKVEPPKSLRNDRVVCLQARHGRASSQRDWLLPLPQTLRSIRYASW